MNRLVEQTLESYDIALRAGAHAHAIDAVWDFAAEGRHGVPAGATSSHDEFYDEHSLPR
jgi:uridine phosphorylase